jgi:hypothetical protein
MMTMITKRGFRLLGIVAALALALGVLSGPSARADSTFHTEQIPLMPVGGAPLHVGFVVDIHTNGPVNYALERYVLVGAAPNTTYQVVTWVYANSSCTTTLLPFPLPDATLQTNVAGNGEAGHSISPAAVDGFRGMTLYLVWQVIMGTTVVYQTACIPVPLD